MPLARQLNNTTIDQLNQLYVSNTWWTTLADHPATFVAARPNQALNVYAGGGSIARVSFQGDQPSLRVHVKYLAELPTAYVDLLDQEQGQAPIPIIDNIERFRNGIEGVIGRTTMYHTGEREGEVAIANSRSSVIDIELAYSFENQGGEDPDTEDNGRSSGRIDLVTCSDNGVLRFVEAKLYGNRELRARGERVPPVCGQLEAYYQWLNRNGQCIADEYRRMVTQMAKLMGQAFDRFRNCPKIDHVDPTPRLLIFGFDQHQQEHANNLADNISQGIQGINGFVREMITCVGGANNVTDQHLTH